jgi:hypothetical protein
MVTPNPRLLGSRLCLASIIREAWRVAEGNVYGRNLKRNT